MARDAANVDRDVVFGKGGTVDLQCDVYKPTGASKRMAVIHYHGGGFAGGNKNGLAARLQAMSALGYTNIAAQYRLSGVARWPGEGAPVAPSTSSPTGWRFRTAAAPPS